MSLEELRADLKRNMLAAKSLTTVEQVRDHLLDTLWPFLEAQIEEVEEIDDAVGELVDQQEDYIQPETAGWFAALLQSSLQLGAELKKRAGGDAALLQLVTSNEQICQRVGEILGDITMMPVEADGEADGQDGGADE